MKILEKKVLGRDSILALSENRIKQVSADKN